MEEKFCARCGTVKPASEFFRSKRLSSGLSSYCKVCCREADKASKAKRQDYHLAIKREQQRRYRERYKEKLRKKNRERKQKYKQHEKAREEVRKAIRQGILSPAKEARCQMCGDVASEYHHLDYERPLDVVPLCMPCHRKLHGQDKKMG